MGKLSILLDTPPNPSKYIMKENVTYPDNIACEGFWGQLGLHSNCFL